MLVNALQGGDSKSRGLRDLARGLGATPGGVHHLQTVREFLPFLWSTRGVTRYRALCAVTTRIYLPFGAHLVEWSSFPRAVRHELSRSASAMPDSDEGRRRAVTSALRAILAPWIDYGVSSEATNCDLAEDACEAAVRLALFEMVPELMCLAMYRARWESEPRLAALQSLAATPPDRCPQFWEALRYGDTRTRADLTEAIPFIGSPSAVPNLIELLEREAGRHRGYSTSLSIIRQLGSLGNPAALPALRSVARDSGHPHRREAAEAIEQLVQCAGEADELKLLRGSNVATLDADRLVRSADANNREELLRSAQGADPLPNSRR